MCSIADLAQVRSGVWRICVGRKIHHRYHQLFNIQQQHYVSVYGNQLEFCQQILLYGFTLAWRTKIILIKNYINTINPIDYLITCLVILTKCNRKHVGFDFIMNHRRKGIQLPTQLIEIFCFSYTTMIIFSLQLIWTYLVVNISENVFFTLALIKLSFLCCNFYYLIKKIRVRRRERFLGRFRATKAPSCLQELLIAPLGVKDQKTEHIMSKKVFILIKL